MALREMLADPEFKALSPAAKRALLQKGLSQGQFSEEDLREALEGSPPPLQPPAQPRARAVPGPSGQTPSTFLERQAFGGGSAFGAAAADAPLEETFDRGTFMKELERPEVQIGLGVGPEIASEMGGQQFGAVTGGVLGSRFGPAGRKVGTAVGRVVGGGLASAGAALSQKKVRGKGISRQDVGNELLLSFLPEVMESAGRASGRQLAKITKGGQEIRMDEAARLAADKAPHVFNSPVKATVSKKFQDVEATGLQFDLDALRGELAQIPDKLSDVVRFDVRAVDRAGRTGKRFETMMQAIQDGANVPIGDLQDLRSILLKREGAASPEARRVLENIRGSIEDAIDTAPPIAGTTLATADIANVRALLTEARREWKQVRSAEDLATLMSTRPVSSVARGGKMIRFNTNALLNTLRDNKSGLTKSVNAAIDAIPGPRIPTDALGARPTRFVEYLEELKAVAPPEIRLTHTQGIARFLSAGSTMLADLMVSRLGQRAFRQALLKGRGTLSANGLAILATEVRRHNAEASDVATKTLEELDAIARELVGMAFGSAPPFPETADQPLR